MLSLCFFSAQPPISVFQYSLAARGREKCREMPRVVLPNPGQNIARQQRPPSTTQRESVRKEVPQRPSSDAVSWALAPTSSVAEASPACRGKPDEAVHYSGQDSSALQLLPRDLLQGRGRSPGVEDASTAQRKRPLQLFNDRHRSRLTPDWHPWMTDNEPRDSWRESAPFRASLLSPTMGRKLYALPALSHFSHYAAVESDTSAADTRCSSTQHGNCRGTTLPETTHLDFGAQAQAVFPRGSWTRPAVSSPVIRVASKNKSDTRQ